MCPGRGNSTCKSPDPLLLSCCTVCPSGLSRFFPKRSEKNGGDKTWQTVLCPGHINLWLRSVCVQLCLSLHDPVYYSPPVSFIHGIFQARYWNGLPFPPPGDRPDPGIELTFPASIPSIGRWILYHWAIWEVPPVPILVPKLIPIAFTYHLLVFGHQNYQYIFTYKNGRVYLNIADLYCNHRFCLTWDMQQLYKSESPCINLRIPLSLCIMVSLENLWQVIYIKLKQNFLCVLLPENWKIYWHP